MLTAILGLGLRRCIFNSIHPSPPVSPDQHPPGFTTSIHPALPQASLSPPVVRTLAYPHFCPIPIATATATTTTVLCSTNARALSLVPEPTERTHRRFFSPNLHHAHVRWNKVCAAQAGTPVRLLHAGEPLCLANPAAMRRHLANRLLTAATAHAARLRY